MIATLADFAPEGVEAGVGLALQHDQGRFLFFLAGQRHRCPPGEIFYAGVGGHREAGEAWVACAEREAREEVGAEIAIEPARTTWYLPRSGRAAPVVVADVPRPLALYEMVHLPGSPRAGQIYRIVVYKARLLGPPRRLPPDEVLGLIALMPEQVVSGLQRKARLADLLCDGAAIVAGAEGLDPKTRLFPVGTAVVLGHVLRAGAVL